MGVFVGISLSKPLIINEQFGSRNIQQFLETFFEI